MQQQTWGSPDMGDVSKKIPSNHVLYGIGCKASNHCHAFIAAAMTEYAHAKMLIASKAMAMTAIDILHHPELLQETRSYFKNRTLVHVNEDLDTTIF